MDRVLILMATYNGEKYVMEQLKSLSKQSYENFEVLISDDASSDKTVKIIENYIKEDDRFQLFKHTKNKGVLENFGFLINLARKKQVDYIMFCDQDDFWLENKIEDSVAEIKKYFNIPTLVYTKRVFTDKDLNKIKLNLNEKVSDTELRILIHQNAVYGCTMIINKELLSILDENIPLKMHDYYIALIARIYGQIKYLNKETILYRQHGDNLSGSVVPLYKKIYQKIIGKRDLKRENKLFKFIVNYIKEKHFNSLTKKDKEMISKLCYTMNNNKKILLLYYLFKYRVFKLSFLGTINFYVQLILGEIND